MTAKTYKLMLFSAALEGFLVAAGTLFGWLLFETTRPLQRLTVLRAAPFGEVKTMTDQYPFHDLKVASPTTTEGR